MSTNKAVWGPAFWLLLHGWAERGLKGPDTDTAWLRLLRWLPEVLPCRVCQEHARLQRRPSSAAEVRLYLYNFHQSVNERLRVGGRPFPIADLGAYQFRDLSAAYELVLASINAGISEGIVRSDAAHAFKAHAEVLRIQLGVN
jgi:hypothetical protein